MLDIGVGLALPDSRVVCYIEREAYACEILCSRMEDKALDDAPVWTDLATFDGGPWRGIVDGIIAGVPCQPHSLAGKRLGELDERDLWPVASRIVGEIMPAFVFLENVPGAVGYFQRRVIPDLERLGYGVAAGLFSAAEVGASHRRERFFILAIMGDPAKQQDHIGEQGELASASRRGACGDHAADPAIGELADAAIARREEPAHENDEQRRLESRKQSGGHGPELAAAKGPRHEGSIAEGRSGADGRAAKRSLPLFAPGPGEAAAWAEILADHPEVAPAVEPQFCRTPDGLAYRLDADRLRLTGNGVIPSQAAFAFVCLAGTLWGGELKGLK